MNVILKNFSLPENCASCYLQSRACELWKKTKMAIKRHEDCPLEELPDELETGSVVKVDAEPKDCKKCPTWLRTSKICPIVSELWNDPKPECPLFKVIGHKGE